MADVHVHHRRTTHSAAGDGGPVAITRPPGAWSPEAFTSRAGSPFEAVTPRQGSGSRHRSMLTRRASADGGMLRNHFRGLDGFDADDYFGSSVSFGSGGGGGVVGGSGGSVGASRGSPGTSPILLDRDEGAKTPRLDFRAGSPGGLGCQGGAVGPAYVVGEVVTNERVFPLWKPLVTLASAVVACTHLARVGAEPNAPVSDVELAVESTLFALLFLGPVSTVARVFHTPRAIPWRAYLKVLPCSFAFLVMCVSNDALAAEVSNRGLAAGFALVALGGLGISTLLLGFRCKRVWLLTLFGAVGVGAHAALLVTRKFPSKHNMYHAWFWTFGLLFFLYFAPRLALPTSSGRAHLEADIATFVHVNCVVTSLLAAVLLTFVLPSFFPVSWTMLGHRMISRRWYFLVWAVVSRYKLQSCILSLAYDSSKELAIVAVGTAGAIVCVVASVLGLLPAPLYPVLNTRPFPREFEFTLLLLGTLVGLLGTAYITGREMVVLAQTNPTSKKHSASGGCPFYVVSLVSLTDALRLLVASVLWLPVRAVASLVSALAPPGCAFFAFPTAVPAREGLDYGVALVSSLGRTVGGVVDHQLGEKHQLFTLEPKTVSKDKCGHIHLSPLVSSMHEPSCPYTQLASGKPPSPSHVPCLCGGLVTIMPIYERKRWWITCLGPLTQLLPSAYKRIEAVPWLGATNVKAVVNDLPYKRQGPAPPLMTP